MLDQNDLELIQKLNQESEQRMTEQMNKLNQESEQRMMALMEAYFTPKFQALGDSIALLTERKASNEVIDDLDDRVTYLEGAVENNTKEIMRLRQVK